MFPMITVPLETLLQMSKMQSHEELKEAGVLREFQENMGKAMFISHQWVSSDHPDPHLTQLSVLQKALQNLLTGQSQVSLPTTVELAQGRLKCPTSADFKAKPLYIWYDFFCCPQGHSVEATAKRHMAISCISSYVARSSFFVILCPSIHHGGYTLNFSTWRARGWCRLEQLARQLAKEDGCMICVKTATHPTLVWTTGSANCTQPGMGEFSFDDDRKKVGHVVLQMVWRKLHFLLEDGDLHRYRVLLNLQRFYFEGFDLDPIESLVPNFETDIDPSVDREAFVVARFLHDNPFRQISERDSAGWSPFCYGVLTGKVDLVLALLKCRADANDRTTKFERDANLAKNLPVLSLAANYHSNEVMRLLLSASALVNGRDGHRCTALSWAAISDNAEAVGLLLEAKVDPLLKAFPDVSPFRTACICGSTKVIKEMLAKRVQVSLRFVLHSSIAFDGHSETISCLIEAKADVNERLKVPMSRMAWWGLLKSLRTLHYLSPSALTYLAHHHAGATPLIFSILTGKFEIIPILLAAGAKLDIPNDRKKTAADFLQQMDVPISWRDSGSRPALKDDDSEDSDDTFTI